jgi:hypothetical protein
MHWNRERRFVVIRQEVAEKETKAHGKPLFKESHPRYLYQAIVTSKNIEEMDATTVYRTYNKRGEFENRIKELKLGCGLEGFCMDSFTATECVLRTLCLVHNLIQHFHHSRSEKGRIGEADCGGKAPRAKGPSQDRIGLRPADAPKQEGKRHMLETLRHTLFTCAAILGRSGRKKVLRFSSSDSWLLRFNAALTRLLAPLSNCKAEQTEGPLMALTEVR